MEAVESKGGFYLSPQFKKWYTESLNQTVGTDTIHLSNEGYIKAVELYKGNTSFDTDVQVGGDHYKKHKIQPLEYALANNLGIMEHAVVKYVTRHQDKGGKQDLEKAIDYLQKMIQHYY